MHKADEASADFGRRYHGLAIQLGKFLISCALLSEFRVRSMSLAVQGSAVA